MTGRRLYDLYCDAVAQEHGGRTVWDPVGREWVNRERQLAWPELGRNEQRVWSHVARRLKGVKR